MRAAWYERQGPAREVLVVGEMPDPLPGAGEVRIRIGASGVNPGDIKKRQNAFSYGMPYPRVIPHSDGAGYVDMVGAGVPASWADRRVWCYGAQSYRPFGTAAEYTVVPIDQVMAMPDGVSLEQGACLGIPGITAHRAVHIAGDVDGRTVLVQGGSGAVGQCAVQLARQAGALVIATVRFDADAVHAQTAGAHHVVVGGSDVVDQVRTLAPRGIDHIVEVAFAANLQIDLDLLTVGGSIATYATDIPAPSIPVWPFIFKNIRLLFLGSDDFPSEAKSAAAHALNDALARGWRGFDIADAFPLADIAASHERVEQPRRGRVVVIP